MGNGRAGEGPLAEAALEQDPGGWAEWASQEEEKVFQLEDASQQRQSWEQA